MRLFFLFFIFLIILVSFSSAVSYDDIKVVAYKLKGSNDNETISNIKDYIYADYGYKFNNKPIGILNTFKTKQGDCTDYSQLMVYMLKVNNIQAKTVCGFAWCGSLKRVTHCWVEINKKYYDVMNCKNFIKIGRILW